MKLHKKGEGFGFGLSTLAKILLILAAGIVIWLFTAKVIGSSILTENERQACRISLIGQGLAMNVDDKIVSPKCPTEYVVFSEDKVEINNKKIKIYLPSTRKTISNFNSLNDEIVNQVVAEQLRLCWWQMLEGKRSFGETFWLYNSVGDNCFICNEIKFDETLSKESFSGIYQYLKSTQIPSQKITYYEYISDIKIYNSQLYDDYPEKNIWEEFADGVKTGESIKDLEFDTRPEIKRELVFEKGKSYYVIFDRHGQKSGIPKTRQGSETEQGLDTTQTFFTYVIPSEQIGEVCNSVSRGITS